MFQRLALASVAAIAMATDFGFAQSSSPNGVRTLSPPGAIKAEGTCESRRASRGFHFCRRHARYRSGDEHFGARPTGSHSTGIAQYQIDCSIGGCEPARLRADHRLRQRSAPVRTDGGQGAVGILGQAAIPTAHDHRGPTPV